MIEILASARTGIGQEYKIKSKKGYFYIAELAPAVAVPRHQRRGRRRRRGAGGGAGEQLLAQVGQPVRQRDW